MIKAKIESLHIIPRGQESNFDLDFLMNSAKLNDIDTLFRY